MSVDSWRELYPFSSNWLTLNEGLRYHYVDEGHGKPLLMVHGNPTWSFYWRNLIAGLNSEFRMVAPDHLGCGLSDKPRDDRQYNLTKHVDRLVMLVDELQLTDITLLVHDWGGAIGLAAAMARPHAFSRFVLFNTGAFPPPFIPWRIRACRIPIVGQIALQGLNLFQLAALRMAVHQQRLPPQVEAGLLAPYDSWHNRRAIYRFVRDIPTSPSQPTWRLLKQLEEYLPQLANCPVSLIWGMRDWCFRPSCLDQFEQLLPHAEVHRIPDAGHWVVEEANSQIVPLVADFVQRHSIPVSSRQ